MRGIDVLQRYFIVSFIAGFFNVTIGQQLSVDSLKISLSKASSDTARCRILGLLVESANEEEWPAYNEQMYNLAEKNLKRISSTHPLARFYKKYLSYGINNKGFILEDKNETRAAIECYNKCLSIQAEIADSNGMAVSLNNMGLAYFNLGNINKAVELYERSRTLCERIGNYGNLASTLNNLGIIYHNQGEIPKALEYYATSLKIYEKNGDIAAAGNTLNNMGAIYDNQGENAKGMEYYQKGLKLREQAKDKFGIASSLNNIAHLFKKEGNSAKALEYFQKSLALYEEIENKLGVAGCLNYIGIIYEDQGDLKKAMGYFEKSLKIQEEIENKDGLTYSLNNISDLYQKQKLYSKALNYAQRSMAISRELGYPANLRNAARQLADIYSATNNYKLAFENYKFYVKMRDSIVNVETRKSSIKSHLKYEFEKKAIADSIKAADEQLAAAVKLEASEAKLKQEKTQRAALYGGLVLVLVFAGFMFNRFKVTQKQKYIIEAKEQETQKQNEIISVQKDLVEEKQKEILDSINYAKRIQHTLLAHTDFLDEHLPEYFVYFNPKDIVSGDFYWATERNGKFYLAVCDSTGHGVPGAFMSLLNISFLNEVINEKGVEQPNEILNLVRQRLIDNISREGQKDGFDGILVCIDKKEMLVTYAAANNRPVLVHGSSLQELNADRMPVGMGERKESFTLYETKIEQGDILYLYTDGYADQFGGPKGKKFKYKPLNELLFANASIDMKEQKEKLEQQFIAWRGGQEQVDDVCVIGIRI
jgi:serine phosphatase RsbU (regulator of sigma subunit)/Tfp pilus assembly protein PilF